MVPVHRQLGTWEQTSGGGPGRCDVGEHGGLGGVDGVKEEQVCKLVGISETIVDSIAWVT